MPHDSFRRASAYVVGQGERCLQAKLCFNEGGRNDHRLVAPRNQRCHAIKDSHTAHVSRGSVQLRCEAVAARLRTGSRAAYITASVTASRRLQIASRCFNSSPATAAPLWLRLAELAAQLTPLSVRPMNHRRREGTLSMRLRVPARMGRKMEHVTPMQGSIPGLQ